MTRLALTAVVALAIPANSTGHAGALAARAPQSATVCSPVNHYCNPGLLPAGVYTTRYFLPGMQVTVPPGGWRSSQDSTTEFKLDPPHNETAAIRFWIDPRASTPCTDHALRVDVSTPTKIVAWLRANKNVVVSAPRQTTISSGIATLSVDLETSRSAPRCASACTGPCIDYFLFSAPGVRTEPFGTAFGSPVRLYFAPIGKASHLFVVGVDAPNKKVFATMTASATKVLGSLRLPTKLPPRRL